MGFFSIQSTRGSIALLIIANRARGMTTFTLHPCHLSPPSILASSSCTPPFPSASPRRADLLVFFPFRPLLWFVRFAQRHGYSCCSSRCFSFFSCCALPPSLPPSLSLSLSLSLSPSLFLSLFASPLPSSSLVSTLGISLPRDAFLLLLPPLLACPSFSSFFSSCSFCFR